MSENKDITALLLESVDDSYRQTGKASRHSATSKSMGHKSGHSAASSGARSRSLGLSYILAIDDPEAQEPSDETIFPKHVQNSSILTVFLLLNTMIGSGILNQPQVFLDAGIVAAVAMLLVTAFFTWLGLVAIIDTGAAFEKFDFSELALFAFGKWGEVIVDFNIAVGNLGGLLSYIIVIGSTSTELLSSWGCTLTGSVCNEYIVTVVLVGCFVTPICLKRVFGELAIYSVLSMISIGSIVLLTMIGGPFVKVGGPIIISKGAGLLSKMGSIIFALSCSFASFHTYVSLKNASAALWRQLAAISILLGTLMLFAVGLAGYLCFRESTEGIILDNFVGNYADVFKVMLVIHLILYIPVDYMAMRHSIIKLSGISTGQMPSELGHFLVTTLLLAGPTGIVLLLHSVGLTGGDAFGLILDFSGGLAGSITSFVMPALFYLRLMPKSAPLYTACQVMAVFGVVVAVMIPVLSILQYT